MNRLVNNTTHVKQANIEMVRMAMRKMQSGTRNEVAVITGLSLATCGNILNQMLKTGEIFEADLEEPNGGRPARRFNYNANFSLIIGIIIIADSGKKTIKYEVSNLLGEQLEQSTMNYEQITFETINDLISGLLSKYDNVKAIGIGVPGVTTVQGNMVTCDIPEMENIKLKTRLVELYDQEIIVENETHSVVYGFYNGIQERSNKDCFAALIVPEGYHHGVGVIANGELLRGHRHLAGEVSLIPKEITRMQMLEEMISSKDKLISIIVDEITSIIAIINPATLILTGSGINEDMVPIILEKCSEKITEIFLPKFEYKEEDYRAYMEGIKAITMKKMDSSIVLIKQ